MVFVIVIFNQWAVFTHDVVSLDVDIHGRHVTELLIRLELGLEVSTLRIVLVLCLAKTHALVFGAACSLTEELLVWVLI